ncbi:MAG: hypothetical protein WD038_05615 [Balneolales bacterium]
MNTFFLRKGHSHLLFPLALFSMLFVFSSCDETGVVGSDIIDEPPPVNADTLEIPATEGVSITTFSGNEVHFSAGEYDDNIFGRQRITGMINPSLSAQEVDSIGENAEGYLKLHVEEVLGDQSASASFDLIEIERRWRAPAWRPDSTLEFNNHNVVASFNIADEDSIRIKLDDEWFGRYADHFNASEDRDDSYKEQMFGLAIVPTNQAKILSFESGKTELIIDNQVSSTEDDDDDEDEPGVFRQFMRATGYSIDRDEIPAPGESTAVLNTFENTLRLKFDITEDFIGSKNVSRAELVLYEDTEAMQDLPAGHERPEPEALYVYMLSEDETERAVLESPNLEMLRNEDDNSFRVNLTSYVNANLAGPMDERDLYVIVKDNDGRIIPTLIHNETSEDREPRILITSANPEK